ncbi:hypothetical protein ETAA8_49150 [Anatilimnocola aggregata]|uniref:Uncharacterized protein n=1 Tax=Anatilimnocola aggregata TaxID=2528021 RepID=A0A517YHT4_9BACT|nr:hypothetical protein [Anatilimnocola aggregata]QDU29800.1 hypothetical protein ETAA8_49150 [Anatilimnocola aggregata]
MTEPDSAARLRSRFVQFLSQVAAGDIDVRAWNEFVVTRYVQTDLESARQQLARAAILGGQCSARTVNSKMQQLAQELLGDLASAPAAE